MSEEILKKFYEVLINEPEEEIRNFILNNFNQFPEELQTIITGLLFEESLEIAVKATEERNKYLEEILSTYQDFQTLKKIFENKIREFQLKKEIEEL